MARFDVYANPGHQAATTPYLLDVQSDLLDGLESRMVVPLRSLSAFPNVKLSNRLTPTFGGVRFFVCEALRDLSTAAGVACDERPTRWTSRFDIVTQPVW